MRAARSGGVVFLLPLLFPELKVKAALVKVRLSAAPPDPAVRERAEKNAWARASDFSDAWAKWYLGKAKRRNAN